MSHAGKPGEKAFEAPAKFDPTEFKWGGQSGSNLSLFAPASFGDNKLNSQAISPLKWEVPANFGTNSTKGSENLKLHEQAEGEHLDDDYFEGDQDYEEPEEHGQSDYNLGGMGLGATPNNLPVVPGGPTNFSFGSSAFSPSAFTAFPALSGPSTTVTTTSSSSPFSPSTFSSAFSAFPSTPFSPAAFNPSSFSSTTATSTTTASISTVPAFATSIPSAFAPAAFGTTSTSAPAFSFSPSAAFGSFAAPPFSASAFTPSSSTTSSTSVTSTFAPFGTTSNSTSSTFSFHVPASTFSPGTSPFTMSTSAFSAGTSMFGNNDEPKPTSTSTFVSSSALTSTTTMPFSFGSTPTFTSAFGPSTFAPATFAVSSTPPTVGGFLREPSFWNLESDAPVFNKNRGFITKSTSVDALEAKLQGWLKDAGVSSAQIEEHRAAFAKFRKEYVPPKVAKHIFVMDAARAFRSPEHQALFILVITYLEIQFKDYHQGLGLISAVLLLLTDPGTVIALVTKFNSDEKYGPGLWKAESVHSATDAYVYWELVAQHMPKLFANLKSITPELFYQKYFCALCVHLLPFESLFIYFGLYAKHGYKAVITFALNIVSHLSKQILKQPEQHELLALLRLESKDVTDATCLAIVTDPKDWQLGSHKWFEDKRVEVFKKYLEKRMKSSADAHKSAEQVPAVECGLCKAVAELYCEECGIDICEDCADANKGGHDQDDHTTYTQEEKPEVEEKAPAKITGSDVADLVAKTAAVSLVKPTSSVTQVAPSSVSPKPLSKQAAKTPNAAKPQSSVIATSSPQPEARDANVSPQVPVRKPDPNRALSTLRADIPSVVSVLQVLDKLVQDKLKIYSGSGIEDEVRALIGDSKYKTDLERSLQRVRQRADPRAYSDEDFEDACISLTHFDEYKELQEVLAGVRLFWQFTRADMSAQFRLLEILARPIALSNIRKVYRKARKLEKIQMSGASTPVVDAARTKLAAAQQTLRTLSQSDADAIKANAEQRYF